MPYSAPWAWASVSSALLVLAIAHSYPSCSWRRLRRHRLIDLPPLNHRASRAWLPAGVMASRNRSFRSAQRSLCPLGRLISAASRRTDGPSRHCRRPGRAIARSHDARRRRGARCAMTQGWKIDEPMPMQVLRHDQQRKGICGPDSKPRPVTLRPMPTGAE